MPKVPYLLRRFQHFLQNAQLLLRALELLLQICILLPRAAHNRTALAQGETMPPGSGSNGNA